MKLPDNIPAKAKQELEKLLNGNINFINGTPTAKICVFLHCRNLHSIKNLMHAF